MIYYIYYPWFFFLWLVSAGWYMKDLSHLSQGQVCRCLVALWLLLLCFSRSPGWLNFSSQPGSGHWGEGNSRGKLEKKWEDGEEEGSHVVGGGGGVRAQEEVTLDGGVGE